MPQTSTDIPPPRADGAIVVRRLRVDADGPATPPDDEALWGQLTAMLHRAYRSQVELGLRPLAGRQTIETTRSRCLSGEPFIAELSGVAPVAVPVGLILFQEIEEAAFPLWFLRRDVSHFSLFAVDPAMQGRGIGSRLLDAVEQRARERGDAELALSMAEPDTALREFYRRRGFRFVQHWRWPYTNYRSVILSRNLRLP